MKLVPLMAVLLPALAAASFSRRLSDISSELERALRAVFQRADLVYSEPDLNVTYRSDVSFQPMGMAHLYNFTEAFVDLIQKKQAYPQGLLEVHGSQIELANDIGERKEEIIYHYLGVFIVFIIAIVFGVALPIVGFCFCCCRCAGKCGGRTQPFDKKHDNCRKSLLATFLILFSTLYMFGLVSTFVTNERVRDGVKDLPAATRVSLYDTQLFLNVTHGHIKTLLKVNYNELKENLNTLLDSGAVSISKQLGEFSKAVSVTTLYTMVTDLKYVKSNLTNMKIVTNQLRTNASQLNDGLRRVKRELLHTLTTCQEQQCRDIFEKYKIGELDTTGIDFNQLPDVTDILNNVTSLLNGSIETEVAAGQKVFENIKKDIEDSVNDQIPKLKTAIDNAGSEIQQFSTKIDNVVKNAHSAIGNVEPHINKVEKIFDEYVIYAWYFGLALCCTFLLIITCITMGLFCGICGKRPDGYGDDWCNKGAGSKFLMWAVAIMFIFGIVLIAVTLVYFLVGVIAQRGFCDPLKNPHDDQLFQLIDKVVNLEHILFNENGKNDFNMSFVITTCHKNKTIYDVLRLDKLVDIKSLQETSERELREKIEDIDKSVQFNNKNTTILKENAINELIQLSDSGLSDFPFDKFTEVLVTNITSIDLISLAKQLRDTADKISGRASFSSIINNLKNQALFLETYQTNLVNPMIREAENLNDTATLLRDGLKFNHTSFKDAVLSLINETKEAEMYFSEEGPDAIKNLTKRFASNIGSIVSKYLLRISDHTRYEVGHCGPLSNVYNATLTATCSRILFPFNGFWFAAGCCILLFIPLIVLSVKLATLYQKSDEYPGPLAETEYLYDAYADRDNVPLANMQRVEKGSSGQGRRRDRVERSDRGDRSAAGRSGGRPRSGESEPRAPVPDGAHPARYNDMAPKLWEDFPAGGPPRYHGPAEYERPPPYYYPGPHSDRS